MKKILLLLALQAACSLPAFAVTTTLVSENFTSTAVGSTVSGWTYEGSNQWRVIDTDTTLDPTAPNHTFYNNGKGFTTGQQNVGVPFANTTLGVGDYISVSANYHYLAAPDNPSSFSPALPFNFFRMGLYNANRGSSSTITGSTYTDDQGYIGDVSYWQNSAISGSTTKTGDYAVRKEVNLFEDFRMGVLLDNLSGAMVGPANDIQTLNATAKPTDDGIATVHSVMLKLTNTGLGIATELYVDGSGTASASYVDLFSGYTFGAPVTTFDTLYFEAPSDNNGFAIDSLSVLTSAPEPSRAMFGLIGLGALVLRRRRK